MNERKKKSAPAATDADNSELVQYFSWHDYGQIKSLNALPENVLDYASRVFSHISIIRHELDGERVISLYVPRHELEAAKKVESDLVDVIRNNDEELRVVKKVASFHGVKLP